MKTLLNILRGILGLLFFLVLLILILLTPTIISTSTLVANRDNPKTWLINSGIYANITDSIKNTLQNSTDIKNSGIKNIDKIIDEVITTDFVQKNANAIIDGTYDFASGKTKTLTINTSNLDISATLKKYLTVDQIKGFEELKSLKPCTEAQANLYESQGGFKSIKDMCLPPTLDILKVSNTSYQTNVVDNPLSKVTNTFQSQSIPQSSLNWIKVGFFAVSFSSYILTGVLLLIGAIYLLVFPGKFFKAYILGFFTIGIGVINVLLSKSTLLVSLILSTIAGNVSFGDFPIPYSTIEIMVTEILKSFFSIYYIVSLVIAIVGGVIFVSTIVINIISSVLEKKKEEKVEEVNPVPAPKVEQ